MSKFKRMRFLEPCNFCGGVAKYHFETGARSYCCEDNVAKCPAIRRRNSEKAKQRPGHKHTEKTKEKIRRGNLGKIASEETKKKMRKPKSEEHRKKISESRLGRKDLINKGSFKKGNIPWHKGAKGICKAWNKGKSRSEEVKRKISQTRTERLADGMITISEETKQKMANSRRGRKHSDETCKKMSLAATGEKSSQWKGGISCEPYCDVWLDKDFKESIKDRDDNKCQNPGCRGNCDHLPLTIHHIDYVKKNCRPDNLITVCVGCNFRANAHREYWTVFYQEIMSEKCGYAYDISKAA